MTTFPTDLGGRRAPDWSAENGETGAMRDFRCGGLAIRIAPSHLLTSAVGRGPPPKRLISSDAARSEMLMSTPLSGFRLPAQGLHAADNPPSLTRAVGWRTSSSKTGAIR